VSCLSLALSCHLDRSSQISSRSAPSMRSVRGEAGEVQPHISSRDEGYTLIVNISNSRLPGPAVV
jgi:hypothetical protein